MEIIREGDDSDVVAGWGLEGTLLQVNLLLLRSGMDAIVAAFSYQDIAGMYNWTLLLLLFVPKDL